jgi:hypothetical protein
MWHPQLNSIYEGEVALCRGVWLCPITYDGAFSYSGRDSRVGGGRVNAVV